MSHSYISAKKELGISRLMAVPDSLGILFMYFFILVSKDGDESLNELSIVRQYKNQLFEPYPGYRDLLIEKISEDAQLRPWFLLKLARLDKLIDEFGEYVDNDLLNQAVELAIERNDTSDYPKPISSVWFKDIFNDIRWVLNEPEIPPSGRYKCFEVEDE